jgi:hypothetical protein
LRPATLLIASCADGNDDAVDLTWTTWGSTQATATGLESWNPCIPDCADDTSWDSTAAQFTLTDPVQTSQGLLFTTLVVQDTGPTPPGFERIKSFSEAPAPGT